MAVFDLAIVGAGPAGMRAAVVAGGSGLSVKVIDEQPNPGGQIWREVERRASGPLGTILGPDYRAGLGQVAAFRASGCDYSPLTQLWQIESIERGFRLFIRSEGQVNTLTARQVLLATGAQERPAPFPGWTLPGVITVGAAQILLKSAGQIPDRPVWVAGSGPLPLLYMVQLLSAGGRIAGYIDTASPGRLRGTWRQLAAGALTGGGPAQLAKGAGWLRRLHAARVPWFRGGRLVRAEGEGRLRTLTFDAGRAGRRTEAAQLLLVHEGVIPSVHIPLSLGCEAVWDEAGEYFRPRTDDWGETTVPGLFVAGDGARVAGAAAAAIQGERTARRIALRLRPGQEAVLPDDRSLDGLLRRETALRPFLDRFYAPREHVFAPADDTIVCRCEEITAAEIRATGATDPNRVKALTRCGMGPCQGRQCGPVVNRILAQRGACSPAEVGLFRVRPPLKPVTLGELAALQAPDGGPGA